MSDRDGSLAADGLVVGVGDLATSAADYAAALGRPFRTVPELGDLRSLLGGNGHASAFVVLRERELTFDRVNEVMSVSTELRLPVGVLPVPDTSAATMPVPRQPVSKPATHSALYCDFVDSFPDGLRATEPVYGARESAEFLSSLRTGMEAAVIHGHGNGADFRIGSDVLCVQVGADRPAPGQPGEGFLPCQGGGPCRLDHKTSFRAFHGAGAIRARLLVMMSCATFHPADGLLDSRFQFVHALLSSGNVAAMVTSTRINFGTTDLGIAALRSLRGGVSLGEITLRMNRLRRYGPPSYLCLGDPEHRPSRLPAATPPRVASAARSALWTEPLLFAADALDLLGGAVTTSESLRAAAVARGGRPDVTGLLAEAVVAGALGDDDPPWVRLCRPAPPDRGPACTSCGLETSVHGYDSEIYRGYRRVTIRCPRHGVLADLPDDFASQPPVEVAVHGDRIAVTASNDSDEHGLLMVRGPGHQAVELGASEVELPVAAGDVYVAQARGAEAGLWRIPLPRNREAADG